MQFYTTTLNVGEILTLERHDGAQMLSIEANSSSSATFLGNLPFKGQAPSAIVINANQILTISSGSPSIPLDGIIVECVTGTVDIIVGM